MILQNTTPVDPNRYEDFDGSPHLFNEFQKGTIYENNINFISDILLNYNGETGTIEYQRDGKIYELDDTFFVKVEIASNNYQNKYRKSMSDTTIFIKGLNSEDYTKFYIMIYGGPNATVFKEFNVFTSTRKIENVGETIKLKTFSGQFLYYVVKGGSPEYFKLRKKNVIEALDGNKEVQAFIKDRQLKLDNENDLKALIEYYNTLEIY